MNKDEICFSVMCEISMALKSPKLQQGFEIICKNLSDLEKENAELKEAIKHVNPCGEWNDDVHDCEFSYYAIEYGSKLTEAKEILERWLRLYKTNTVKGIIKDTEQFLKEVSK